MKLILTLTLFLSMMGCSIVGPGEKGLITHFGAIQTDILESGIYLWIPLARSIHTFDLRVQKDMIEATAASKDLQDVHSQIAVNWRIDPTKVMEFYKDVGWETDALDKILKPAVAEVFKAATSKKTAEEIVGRRAELKQDIDENLNKRIARYFIKVDDVSIVDVKFSPDFTKAIEDKQIAEQQAKQAEYVAQKAIKEADAERNRARGQADAQNLLKQTLNPELLKLKAIEKWDGKFPHYMGGGALPFLNIKEN